MTTKPQAEVTIIPMEDPEFEGGSVHSAIASITNNAGAALSYQMELYLGASKAATSGVVTQEIAAGATAQVPFSLTAPIEEGTYPVYLDVLHEGALVVHGQASEDVVVVVTPSVTIGDITWS